ncbi:MAG: fibronectin type III domain-containing protein, partial [Acidimicrobiales bacterium]|nr:fibronectin type III domain-containing protein [Acidimicrobiales bacterium]
GTRVMASFVPAAVPAAPAAPSVSAGDASAVVWWNPPADDGGAELTGYRITASPSGGSLDVGAGTTLVTFEGLQNGTAYTFTVEALNDVGASAPSAASAVVVPAGPPARPSAPLASAGDGWVQVSWTAPGDGGSAIEHYVVRASPGGAEQIVQAPATEVLFGGLTNGTAYRFSVTAVNAVGHSEASAMSDRATPVASVRVPERPGRPQALAGDGTAQLWWAPPVNTVSTYRVEAWVGPVGSGDPIVSLQVATNEAVVEGLNNASSYTFTVVGVNSAGVGERSPESSVVVPRVGAGYWVLGSDGQVYPFGDAELYGDLLDQMAPPVLASIDIERLPTGDGYWILDSLGRVWAFGNARHHGNVDLAQLRPGEVPATMSSTPTGDGYWVFTDAGRALAFGSAGSFGDVSDLDLDGPIISSVATPTGRGYYMVGSDGGIFALGDATFQGSIPQVLPGVALDGPVVGIVPTPTGHGYWLVASDGGVFAFGDAWFNNSIPGVLAEGESLVAPVNGMVAFADGYVMVAGDGGVFNFSSRPFFGSLGADSPASPIVGISPQEPVPAPGRFVGDWTGSDPGDGSTQTIQISATGWVDEPVGERWSYRVLWEDDRATSCRPYGDDYPARLVVSASGPGNSLVVAGRFACAAPAGDIELDPFTATLVYNPATDTLSDGVSEFRRP